MLLYVASFTGLHAHLCHLQYGHGCLGTRPIICTLDCELSSVGTLWLVLAGRPYICTSTGSQVVQLYDPTFSIFSPFSLPNGYGVQWGGGTAFCLPSNSRGHGVGGGGHSLSPTTHEGTWNGGVPCPLLNMKGVWNATLHPLRTGRFNYTGGQ